MLREFEKKNLAARFVKRVTKPVERFMELEAASGLTLIVVTLITLAIANSDYSALYHHLIQMPLGFQIGSLQVIKTFEHWVNDGLMVIFFYVVGLEIKREMMVGELASLKKAALPMFAALGGMIVPALIYAHFNHDQPSHSGWGIPMATDIAFAVGVLVLLGKRIPFSLKIFLLALAIVDDLGAVLVIAIFYTQQIHTSALAIAAALIGLIAFLRIAGVRTQVIYLALSVLTWFAVLKSGVHATIAGVVLGFLTPLTPLLPKESVERFTKPFGQDYSASNVGQLRDIFHHAMSPLERMLDMLTPWVSFVIMPVFAFTNAGLTLADGHIGDIFSAPVVVGILLGLFLGKPIGIALFAFFACKMKWAELPKGVNWGQVIGVGSLAGIGFTMALFIAHLSLPGADQLNMAKLSILMASLFSAIVGAFILITWSRSSAG